MSLHKFIPDNELPEALKRPLVFGDKEQVSALYELDSKIANMETDAAKEAGAGMKYFNVTVEVEGFVEIKVLAVSEKDAEEKAVEEVALYDSDFELSAYASIPKLKEVKK